MRVRGAGVNCFRFYDAFYLVNGFDVGNFNRKQLQAANTSHPQNPTGKKQIP